MKKTEAGSRKEDLQQFDQEWYVSRIFYVFRIFLIFWLPRFRRKALAGRVKKGEGIDKLELWALKQVEECLDSPEYGGTERKTWRRCRGRFQQRYLVLERSQQQNSCTYILGRHTQRRRHSRDNSSSSSSSSSREDQKLRASLPVTPTTRSCVRTSIIRGSRGE